MPTSRGLGGAICPLPQHVPSPTSCAARACTNSALASDGMIERHQCSHRRTFSSTALNETPLHGLAAETTRQISRQEGKVIVFEW